jgi:hypothetical protein
VHCGYSLVVEFVLAKNEVRFRLPLSAPSFTIDLWSNWQDAPLLTETVSVRIRGDQPNGVVA